MATWGTRPILALALAAGPSLAALPVAAHPHMFIDTGIEVIFDDAGRATALRISWSYDEFNSLAFVQDRGIDPDGDGEATPEEDAALSGFDMNWDPGISGDTYALAGDVPLALGRPRDWTASYHGGRILSTHVRDIDPPLDPAQTMLVIQAYDTSFYTAYTIASDPLLTGRSGCTAQVFAPDLDEADKKLQAALAEYSADEDVEANFPAVGAAYSDEVRVTCANPS